MVTFLDTYAIIEIDKGNGNYGNYYLSRDSAFTTVLNLLEVHFYYLKNYGKKEAEEMYAIVKRLVTKIDNSILKEATAFKLFHLKKRFSFADCVGYVTAKRFNARFLTGDYAFKGLPNVEFVK